MIINKSQKNRNRRGHLQDHVIKAKFRIHNRWSEINTKDRTENEENDFITGHRRFNC